MTDTPTDPGPDEPTATEAAFVDPGYDTFAGHLGQPFTVRREGGPPVTLQLTTVDGERPAGPSDAHSFSVTFQGPASDPLPQGTYEFENPDAGRFLLFIVPVGRAGETTEYEAVFTRLATP